jgi:AraC-like DNA-binding protein
VSSVPFDASANSIWVSADALSGCVEVAYDAGFDVRPYLARHGIDVELIENSRGLLSYQAMSNCLDDIARSEQCADFGFELGRRQKPLQFGMISQVLQFAPTVGEAIRIFLRYRDLYSQSSHWDLSVEDDVARLKRRDFGANARRSAQVTMLSVTRGFEAIRSMMGADWTPIGIYLSTGEVAYSDTMRRFFGSPVFFNSEHDEIAFDAVDLQRPVPTGNAEILKALTNHFDRLFPELNRRGPVSAQVQKQIRIGLETGECDLDVVARYFGMHPRTLQRALAAEGSTFRALMQETRMSIAAQSVETSRVQLSEVAMSVGYSHSSSFSRAYKRVQGKSPREDRARNRAIKQAV